MNFDERTVRVLGSLMEKEMTTPENYPLSLNALINACNQRSSREPVMDLAEEEVRQALHHLQSLNWVSSVRDARVPKYEHRVRTVLQLRRDETAILCLLLLRGPQTPGELRGRADRMYAFDDLPAVQAALDRLAARTVTEADETSGPLVAVLPRQHGSSAPRWMHQLAGRAESLPDPPARPSYKSADAQLRPGERIAELEVRVADLETQVIELRALLALAVAAAPASAPKLLSELNDAGS